MANRTKSRGCAASEPTKRSENSDIRKLRNRNSQKAYRARQAMRMKELEDRLCNGAYSDAELVTHLQDQNATLREHLLECHKKFNSLQVSMKALASMSATALGIERVDNVNEVCLIQCRICLWANAACKTDSTTEALCARCKKTLADQKADPAESATSSGSRKEQRQLKSPGLDDNPIEELPDNAIDNNDPEADENSHQYAEQEHRATPSSSADAMGEIWTELAPRPEIQAVQNFNLDYFSSINCDEKFDHNELLTVRTADCPTPLCLDLVFTEDLGPLKYKNILEVSPSIGCRHFKLQRTNSPFSDHIDALEQCISWNYSRWNISPLRDEQFSNPLGSILLTFVSMSWQSMTAWHTYTNAHIPLKDLMAWRICRTPDRYLRITPAYQPTKLQMSIPHPSIIDWIPWPQLRDKLITHHSANPRLDSLICDIGNSYVVQADLSRLIKCPDFVLGYLGVWDLVRAIAPEATGSPEHSSGTEDEQWTSTGYDAFSGGRNTFENLSLPAKDAHTLFSSQDLAVQAFKLLGMDKGAFNFRLDPAFFGRHPELYDNSSGLMATGVALQARGPRINLEPARSGTLSHRTVSRDVEISHRLGSTVWPWLLTVLEMTFYAYGA